MKKICFSVFCSVITAMAMCQVRAVKVNTTATTNTAMYSALNATPKQTSTAQSAVKATYGSVLPASLTAVPLSPCATGDCQGISIRYEVPGFVVIDRFLLGANLLNKIAALVDQQQTWQNMSSSQVSDQTRQEMVNLLQQQIDNLQGMSDALQTSCAPVDFKNYSTSINADVRYNDPVSGSFPLSRANGNGDVDLSQFFANVPYSILEGNPVRGTLLIYRK